MAGLYLNQSRRVNWAAGAFRLSNRAYEGNQFVSYVEKTYGALVAEQGRTAAERFFPRVTRKASSESSAGKSAAEKKPQ